MTKPPSNISTLSKINTPCQFLPKAPPLKHWRVNKLSSVQLPLMTKLRRRLKMWLLKRRSMRTQWTLAWTKIITKSTRNSSSLLLPIISNKVALMMCFKILWTMLIRKWKLCKITRVHLEKMKNFLLVRLSNLRAHSRNKNLCWTNLKPQSQTICIPSNPWMLNTISLLSLWNSTRRFNLILSEHSTLKNKKSLRILATSIRKPKTSNEAVKIYQMNIEGCKIIQTLIHLDR